MSVKSRRVQEYGRGARTKSLVLKSLFETSTPNKWTMPKSRKSSKDKKDDSSTEDKHTASSADLKAVLHKDGDYKGNFSDYIKTDNDRKDVYMTISANAKHLFGTHRPLILELFENYFKLGSVECNFNYKAVLQKADSANGKRRTGGCSKPYNWEAHHLIPGEAFTTMETKKGSKEEIFTPTQYQLLLMSDYDINHGHNIIALPANNMDFFQPVHDLIQHPSNHAEYTKLVIKELKALKQDLQDAEDELGEDHPQVTVAITNSLRDRNQLEDKLWKLLIKIGKASVTAKVTKEAMELEAEERELLKYQAKSGTKYKYGALK
ncbi:AHH domain-containing protein [Agarilytica rhodophyticola]|uniref:AHH domain-containing protein n=1 Tax=Agarilytica rhodophyticola TaxID=1737490 RepID=UPI000B345C68|nr:AHH domain-containing protein [Agarilytica rhodophyticola]